MGVEDNSFSDLSSKLGHFERPKTELDDILEKARETRPEYVSTKDEIIDIFNSDPFDHDYAMKRIESWNKAEENRGRLVGSSWSVPRILCKHGRVSEYYYSEKQGFRIGYELKR